MKNLIDKLAPYIGPKATAAIAGATTLSGQIEQGLASSSYDIGPIDLIVNAVTSGNFAAILPAPIAAVVGYVARRSKSPVYKNGLDTANSAVIVPYGKLLDDLSIIADKDGNHFTYGELIEGKHLPPEPVDPMGELTERVGKLEHIVDGCYKETNEAYFDLAKQVAKMQADMATSAVKTPDNDHISGHERRALAVDDKVRVDEVPDADTLIDKLRQYASTGTYGLFRFSNRSMTNLEGVDEPLVRVFKRALDMTPFDFVVTRGFATQSEQAAILRKRPRVSWTKNSRHMYGKAVDIAAIDENGEITWKMPYYVLIAEAVQQAAEELGYPVTSGAIHWGKDGPHHELSKDAYPDDGSLRIDDPSKY